MIFFEFFSLGSLKFDEQGWGGQLSCFATTPGLNSGNHNRYRRCFLFLLRTFFNVPMMVSSVLV